MNNPALIKALEQEREHLLKKLKLIDQAIRLYRDDSETMKTISLLAKLDMGHFSNEVHEAKVGLYAQYDQSKNIRYKVMTIIHNEGRFLHVREIAKIAHRFEPDISVQSFIRKISPALSLLKKMDNPCVVSKIVAKSHFDTFWGLPEWLDEKGDIKADFWFNDQELSYHKKKMLQL